jgi:hypothetical protein
MVQCALNKKPSMKGTRRTLRIPPSQRFLSLPPTKTFFVAVDCSSFSEISLHTLSFQLLYLSVDFFTRYIILEENDEAEQIIVRGILSTTRYISKKKLEATLTLQMT